MRVVTADRRSVDAGDRHPPASPRCHGCAVTLAPPDRRQRRHDREELDRVPRLRVLEPGEQREPRQDEQRGEHEPDSRVAVLRQAPRARPPGHRPCGHEQRRTTAARPAAAARDRPCGQREQEPGERIEIGVRVEPERSTHASAGSDDVVAQRVRRDPLPCDLGQRRRRSPASFLPAASRPVIVRALRPGRPCCMRPAAPPRGSRSRRRVERRRRQLLDLDGPQDRRSTAPAPRTAGDRSTCGPSARSRTPRTRPASRPTGGSAAARTPNVRSVPNRPRRQHEQDAQRQRRPAGTARRSQSRLRRRERAVDPERGGRAPAARPSQQR